MAQKATIEAKRAARSAALRTRKLNQALSDVDRLAYLRRHDLLKANEGGVTYRDLHAMTGMSLTVIGEQIAKAKTETEAGVGPTANGQRPAAVASR